MTTPSNLWDDRRGRQRQGRNGGEQRLSRIRARRMSRRFADVGVGIPAARLREISAGAPFVSDEFVDLNFALTAIDIKRQQRRTKLKRTKSRAIRCLIVAGLILAALNLLLCMAFVFVSLALHESPF